MERILLKIRLTDRINSNTIRNRTGFIDAIERAKTLKWKWVGHIDRLKDNRWTILCTNWIPFNYKRKQGRQRKRWKDEIIAFNNTYYRTTQDRTQWKELGRIFSTQNQL